VSRGPRVSGNSKESSAATKKPRLHQKPTYAGYHGQRPTTNGATGDSPANVVLNPSLRREFRLEISLAMAAYPEKKSLQKGDQRSEDHSKVDWPSFRRWEQGGGDYKIGEIGLSRPNASARNPNEVYPENSPRTALGKMSSFHQAEATTALRRRQRQIGRIQVNRPSTE